MRAALDRQASAQIDMALGQRVIGPDDHLHLLAVVREVVVVLHLAAVRLPAEEPYSRSRTFGVLHSEYCIHQDLGD